MGEPADPPVQRNLGTSGDAGLAVKIDRRRPGRIKHTSPHLIALLRRPQPPAEEAASARLEAEADILPPAIHGAEWRQEADSDDLAPARGIALALLVSAPFWAGIAALCVSVW